MKKVLLATTALTLSAGFASAEISMSGSAEAGIHSNAGADHVTFAGVDIDIAISGASDNGMSFSTSVDMGSGSLLDGFDPLDAQTATIDAPTISIGMEGFTIAVGEAGANDNLYDDDLAGGAISVSGAAGDASFAIVTGLDDADSLSASLGYSMGALGVSAAMTDIGDVSSITVSYDMGDMNIAVTSDDGTSSAEITYTTGALSTTIEVNIFIVGPMGSGKSTVGKIISSELFLNFFDTDEEIETRTGASIDWIFDLEGEEGFRKRESNILEEMVQQNSIVLSTGGGIILSESNRELLSSRGSVFYLATPIEVQLERTSKDKDRPLLKNGDPGKILEELHMARECLYEAVADHIVNTEGKSSQEVSSEIIKLVKNYG
jgi:shikimate kinase